MLQNRPARPKGSAAHCARAGQPYTRQDQEHFSPSHALGPQRNHRYNDTFLRKSNHITCSSRTRNHSSVVVGTCHCSNNHQRSSPRHYSQKSRLGSKKLDTPFRVEPTNDIFIQESFYQRSTSSTAQSKHLVPPTQVPFRATHVPSEMRKFMSVFRLNPFSIQYGDGDEASSLQWNGQEVGPLTEEPQYIEFQLDWTTESINVDSPKVSQKSDKTAVHTTAGRTERNEYPRPLLQSSDLSMNNTWLLVQFQPESSRIEEFAYDELDSIPSFPASEHSFSGSPQFYYTLN